MKLCFSNTGCHNPLQTEFPWNYTKGAAPSAPGYENSLATDQRVLYMENLNILAKQSEKAHLTRCVQDYPRNMTGEQAHLPKP